MKKYELVLDDKAKIRFLSKINKTDNCWEWIGSISSKGYGVFWLNGKNRLAHRVSFINFKKSIDENLCIDHICRNRKCVNPGHLRSVTVKVNNIENSLSASATNKKKTHCKNGHEFTSENTYTNKSRSSHYRVCRKCNRKQVEINDPALRCLIDTMENDNEI